MIPQVVSVRVETAWHTPKPLLACIARISRALTSREREEMARFAEFSVGGGKTVTWSCRPEETEASEKRLAAALRRSAQGSRGGRRRWPAPVRTF